LLYNETGTSLRAVNSLAQYPQVFSASDSEAIALINELQQLKIKHNAERIVRIAKLSNGQIIFLERGKGGEGGSGLQHILENHQKSFKKCGIEAEQIADAVMLALTMGKFVGYQPTRSPTPRSIYEVNFNEIIQYIAITVGDNGYIVGANPTSKP
jgi:hypothetical protein